MSANLSVALSDNLPYGSQTVQPTWLLGLLQQKQTACYLLAAKGPLLQDGSQSQRNHIFHPVYQSCVILSHPVPPPSCMPRRETCTFRARRKSVQFHPSITMYGMPATGWSNGGSLSGEACSECSATVENMTGWPFISPMPCDNSSGLAIASHTQRVKSRGMRRPWQLLK